MFLYVIYINNPSTNKAVIKEVRAFFMPVFAASWWGRAVDAKPRVPSLFRVRLSEKQKGDPKKPVGGAARPGRGRELRRQRHQVARSGPRSQSEYLAC